MHHLPRIWFYPASEGRRFHQLLARALLETFQFGLVELSIKSVHQPAPGSHLQQTPAAASCPLTQATCHNLSHEMAPLSYIAPGLQWIGPKPHTSTF